MMLARLRQRLRRFVDGPPAAGIVVFVLLGILAPVLCFRIDEAEGFGLSSSALWFAWMVEASALGLWLSRRVRTRTVTALVGGVLFFGTIVGVFFSAFTVPFAVFFVAGGVVDLDPKAFGLGLLGFVPLACAFVYFAASWGALRCAMRSSGDPSALLLALLGLLGTPGLVLGSALTLESAARSCTRAVARGERDEVERRLFWMGPFARLADWNELARAGEWGSAGDGEGGRIQVADRAYAIETWEHVTGREHDEWLDSSD